MAEPQDDRSSVDMAWSPSSPDAAAGSAGAAAVPGRSAGPGAIRCTLATMALNAVLVIVFALSFLAPIERREWRSFGVFSAFVIALFTEMYGFPLTIYRPEKERTRFR